MITKKYYKMIRVSYADSDYFRVTNVDTTTGTLTINGANNLGLNLEYSTDGVNWTTADSNAPFSLAVPAGSNVYMRGTNSDLNSKTIRLDANYTIGGNILSIIDKTNYKTITSINGSSYHSEGTFGSLFRDETHLISAGEMNFGNLATANNFCGYMFYGCTSLTTPPDMSSLTQISGIGIRYMFYGCTSLTTPPDMSSLTQISGSDVLKNCFQNCTSLTVAPTFFNLTNIGGNMGYCFNGCSNLSVVYAPNISTWDTGIFSNWLGGVAASGVVMKPSTLTIPTNNNSGVPSGWTTQDY